MFDAMPYQPPPVDYDEMSFAIALFVAAARGRTPVPNMRSMDLLQESQVHQSEPLLSGARAVLEDDLDRLPDEVALACAVSVLWHHYEEDARQQAICSRLVAFYALVARRQGQLFAMESHEAQSLLTEAALSPAVVKAVADATVGEGGLFDDAQFDSLVKSFSTASEVHAGGSASLIAMHPLVQPGPRLAVSESVQQLSLQLFAFQSCVVADPTRPKPHFRALEQLCVRVTEISGGATLQAMLARAWRAALPEYPWMECASPTNARLLIGLDAVEPAPTPREAMKCEMTLLGLLIELLRSLLGDGVTLQLLRSLWPLASLNADRQTPSELMDVRGRDGVHPRAGRIQ